jgi:septum formation protein
MRPKQPLLLASQSAIRRQLLTDAHIPFETISHTAHEESIPLVGSAADIAQKIARLKIDSIILRPAPFHTQAFVLTADTVVADSHGILYAKPTSKADLLDIMEKLSDGALIATAFCLEKRQILQHGWETVNHITGVATATCSYSIPSEWREYYIKTCPHAFFAAGGMTIEGFGAQFVKELNGSYTAALGLPLFELRQALEAVSYFIP